LRSAFVTACLADGGAAIGVGDRISPNGEELGMSAGRTGTIDTPSDDRTAAAPRRALDRCRNARGQLGFNRPLTGQELIGPPAEDVDALVR
jgi:hypothetical protein